MIEKMQIDHLKKLNDYNINDNFGRFVEESSLEKERRLQLTGKLEEKRENKEEKAKIKQEINK